MPNVDGVEPYFVNFSLVERWGKCSTMDPLRRGLRVAEMQHLSLSLFCVLHQISNSERFTLAIHNEISECGICQRCGWCAIYGSFLEIFYQRKCVQFDGSECNRAGPRAREAPSYKADTDING